MAKRTQPRGLMSAAAARAMEVGSSPDPAHSGAGTLDTGGGGGGLSAEVFTINTVGAVAEIAGLNTFTLQALFRDTDAFREARPGQGADAAFLISEVFVLAVWRYLADRGVSLKNAMRIVPRSLDPYGLLKNNPFAPLRIAIDPGPAGRDERPLDPVKMEIDLWVIWADVWPRFRDYVRRRSRDPNMPAALAAFERHMKSLRSDENLARLQAAYEADKRTLAGDG